ncbi:hypothetical protein SDC9_49399 [bioreactor metagenome]|uniref:Uncharacterized protein n=1 Tax=bioreactor metagenome TaxID=1076179 RepID=A0A644WHR3_9ZZZZ
MKQYGYHEVRKMSFDSLRGLCIRKNWFTNGTNKDYEAMLNQADDAENITTDIIVEIASQIIENSDMSKDFISDEIFESVCFELFDICNTFIAKD